MRSSTTQWPQRGMQYGESVRDIVLTMFLPTLLLFAARAMPQLFRFDGESKA